MFLLTGIPLSIGQTDQQQTSFHQIGLNVGPLWSNIIHHDSRQDLNNFGFAIFDIREVVSYKFVKNKAALRFGIGGKYKQQKSEDNTDNKSTQTNFSARLGLEKIVDLTDKWQYYYGADLKAHKGKIKENFSDEPYQWYGVNLSNFIGIQYRLTPRLILQTEASLLFSYTVTENPIFFFDPIFVEPGGGTKTRVRSVDIVLPNILFLAFEF